MKQQSTSIAFDILVGWVIALLALSWGGRLLLGYYYGAQVQLFYAVALLGVGFLGVLIFFFRPICVASTNEKKISIYSWLGLRSANYDVKTQLISKEWDKSSTYLKLTFNDGKTFRFSKHSFFRLKKFSEHF
jgi:hypothetical protein